MDGYHACRQVATATVSSPHRALTTWCAECGWSAHWYYTPEELGVSAMPWDGERQANRRFEAQIADDLVLKMNPGPQCCRHELRELHSISHVLGWRPQLYYPIRRISIILSGLISWISPAKLLKTLYLVNCCLLRRIAGSRLEKPGRDVRRREQPARTSGWSYCQC